MSFQTIIDKLDSGIWKGQYIDEPHSFNLENKKYFVPRIYDLAREKKLVENVFTLPLQIKQTPLTCTPWAYNSDKLYLHCYVPRKDIVVDLIGKISTYRFGSKTDKLGLSNNDFWFDDSNICRLLLLKL